MLLRVLGAEVDVMFLCVSKIVNDRSKEAILKLKPNCTKLHGYGGGESSVHGACTTTCKFRGKLLCVLGLDSCKKLELVQDMYTTKKNQPIRTTRWHIIRLNICQTRCKIKIVDKASNSEWTIAQTENYVKG